MSERWRRFRSWSWALWVPLTVAVISAALALYLALWASYDIVPGLTFDWLGTPRLSTTQILPLLIGALGVMATVSAILAGVGELGVVFPRQRVTVGVARTVLTRDRWEIWVIVRNGDTYIAGLRVDLVLLDASGNEVQRVQGVVTDSNFLPGETKEGSYALMPGGEASVKTIRLEWATDRRRGLQHKETPFPPPPTREE